jgi:type III secretion protein J
MKVAGRKVAGRKGGTPKATATTCLWGMVLALGLSGACTTDLLHDLDESSANAAVTALEGAGIAAEKTTAEAATSAVAPRFGLRVPSRQTARALAVLAEVGLPRAVRSGFAEIYARPALIPSAFEERARFVLAAAAEVERTLESVDGVVSARVHLVPEEPDPSALDGRNRSPARAAVLLRVRPGVPGLPLTDVQRLIAGSIPGLDPTAVVVVETSTAPQTKARSDTRSDGKSESAALAPTDVLARLGPFQVARDSRGPLALTAVLTLLALGTLAVLLLVTLRRRDAGSAIDVPPGAAPE